MKARKEDNAQMHYSVISSSVYEAVSNEITRPIYTSLTLANDVLLIDVLRNEEAYDEEEAIGKISQYLAAVKESIHANTAFLVSEKTKRYYYAEGLNKVIDIENDEHDVWYSIFTNTRKPYDLDVDADQTNGNSWTVFVNARVEDENGNLLGVCGTTKLVSGIAWRGCFHKREGDFPSCIGKRDSNPNKCRSVPYLHKKQRKLAHCENLFYNQRAVGGRTQNEGTSD